MKKLFIIAVAFAVVGCSATGGGEYQMAFFAPAGVTEVRNHTPLCLVSRYEDGYESTTVSGPGEVHRAFRRPHMPAGAPDIFYVGTCPQVPALETPAARMSAMAREVVRRDHLLMEVTRCDFAYGRQHCDRWANIVVAAYPEGWRHLFITGDQRRRPRCLDRGGWGPGGLCSYRHIPGMG